MAGALAGFAASPLIGYWNDHYGWEPTFFILAGVFFAAGVAWFFIDSNRRLLAEGHS